MKYIGNKTRLLDFIDESIKRSGIRYTGVFADLFSGTASVGKYFKQKGFSIISSDIMSYSYVMQRSLIMLNDYPGFGGVLEELGIKSQKSNKAISAEVINQLNSIDGLEGFISKNYSPAGRDGRQYFTTENARRIDSIRTWIEEKYIKELISSDEYYFLLCSIINAADYSANMSGTYGAYLKIWRSVALNPLKLLLPEIIHSNKQHRVYKKDANELIKSIKSDVLYLDPPYNSRQYAPNFHILETIACWDSPKIKGVTGLRPYDHQKSLYSMRRKAEGAFRDLIANADTKHILLSYNNEGILSDSMIKEILSSRGNIKVYERIYRRFRTERDHEKRQYKKVNDKVTERIYYVEVIN